MVALAGILVLGILAQWLAWKVKLPAILPLIIIGLLVGPFSTFFVSSHQKLIDTDAIFKGEVLFDFLSLAVGVILFEGGLSLKIKDLKGTGTTVISLVVIGTVVTLLGATFACHYIMGMTFKMSMLFGSLVIVTGPTVIKPILRNVRPNHKVATLLNWEGVLIDPVGALVALLAYEFIVSFDAGANITSFAIKETILTVASGSAVGFFISGLIYYLLKKELVPTYLRNVVVLALIVMTVSLADQLVSESGLFAVTLAGIILTNTNLKQINFILSFKEDITLILVSILFIMLSARIDMEDIYLLGPQSLLLFAVVVYALRPITIFLSTIGANLNLNEKLFLSWIAPRGIVSAGVASIFSIRILASTNPNVGILEKQEAELILPLTFLVIIGTVVIQGFTAKPIAKLLKIYQYKPNGVLFIGADQMTRFIALYLHKMGVPVLLSDTSTSNIKDARALGLDTFEGSLLVDKSVTEEVDLSEYGQVWAMTSSNEINMLACRILRRVFGDKNVYRFVSKREYDIKELSRPDNLLFNGKMDFYGLIQLMRKNPRLKTFEIQDELKGDQLIKKDENITLLFFIKPKGTIIPFTKSSAKPKKGDTIVYINNIEVAV